jgi:hypothetical protein
MSKILSIVTTLVLMMGVPARSMAVFLDIASGGAPTITGALSGSVIGSSDVTTNLSVTINFGEVSPLNTSSYVKVTVPIAIRSDRDYKVTAAITGGTNANAQALQRTDIGFGINNFRSMGSKAKVCTKSTHLIYSPFNNDPASSMSILASGRVAFTSDLADPATGTTLVSGPTLSTTNRRDINNGYIFDAIFVIAPQFFANGNTTATITFTITDGFNAAC